MEEFLTDDMIELYVFENRKLIEDLVELVLKNKDEESFDEVTLKAIFRTMHTMKGSAGLMSYDDVGRLAHKMEDVFYYIREEHPKHVDHLKTIEYVLNVCDFITRDIDKVEAGDPDREDPSELIDSIGVFMDQMKKENSEPEEKKASSMQIYVAPAKKEVNYRNYYRVCIYYKKDTQMPNMRAYRTVKGLEALQGAMVYSPANIIYDNSTSDVIMKEGFKILIGTDSDEMHIRHIIDTDDDAVKVDVFSVEKAEYDKGFTRDVCSEKKEYVPGDFVVSGKPYVEGSRGIESVERGDMRGGLVPVEAKKLDGLTKLVEELMELQQQNGVCSRGKEITAKIYESLISMKKIPLTKAFHRMNRIVFDASRKLGKSIECVMIGDELTVDINLIEHISDPLMHLVRNAVDHGIETPEERVRLGKREKAKIVLEASKRGAFITISVSDDGAGIDRDMIIKKAVERGLIGDEASAAALSDKEVYDFILQSGFSTSQNVGEFSGRGVGMDVVVSTIKEIGGKLIIESKKGEGSKFSMRFKESI